MLLLLFAVTIGLFDKNIHIYKYYRTNVTSHTCLDCDILHVRLPLNSSKDQSIEGSCPIPPVAGNSIAIVSTMFDYMDRCGGGHCVVWLAFLGDSQLRGPFMHMVDMLLGSEWPVGAQRNVFEHVRFQTDHRVCCNVQDHNHQLACTLTRAFGTAAYVRDFLRIRGDTHSTRKLCVTWQFNQMADANMRETLTDYTGVYDSRGNRFHDAARAPQMIVMNPGLWPIFVGQNEVDYVKDINRLLSHIHFLAKAQISMSISPTRFVMHEITAVIDADLSWYKVDKVNDSMATRFNEALSTMLQEAQRIDGSSQWLQVFPANRLTKLGHERGLIQPSGDGIHFKGGYDNIVTQFDLYFMNPTAASKLCRSR